MSAFYRTTGESFKAQLLLTLRRPRTEHLYDRLFLRQKKRAAN